jgi:hypothetical protein
MLRILSVGRTLSLACLIGGALVTPGCGGGMPSDANHSGLDDRDDSGEGAPKRKDGTPIPDKEVKGKPPVGVGS